MNVAVLGIIFLVVAAILYNPWLALLGIAFIGLDFFAFMCK